MTLFTAPIDPSELEVNEYGELDSHRWSHVAAIIRGEVTGRVISSESDEVTIITESDPVYSTAVELAWGKVDLLAIRVLEAPTPRKEATVGDVELSFEHGTLRANGESFPAALVSALADVRGYVYGLDPTDSKFYSH